MRARLVALVLLVAAGAGCSAQYAYRDVHAPRCTGAGDECVVAP